MTLRDQLNAYKGAKTADDSAAGALTQAQGLKLQTGGDLATATSTFAHGLAAKGGSAIDATATPPVLYAAGDDGTTFTATPVPSLDDEVDGGGDVPIPPSAPSA